MSLPFSIALSTLQANQVAIQVVGNNLANLNTSGYKSNSVGFADLMTESANGGIAKLQTGAGVSSPQTIRQFTQGGMNQTSGYLDAAIQGNGFFVVKTAEGQQLYTRDGSFVVDKSGVLRTQGGEAVQGWTGGGLSNITVSTDAIPAVQTTNFSLSMNLNSSNPQAFTAPIQVFDGTGRTIDLTATFTPGASGEWTYSIAKSSDNSVVASGNMTFDSNGVLTSPSSSVQFPVTNANGVNQTLTWNLIGSNKSPLVTQYAMPTKVNSTTQDGSPAAEFVRAKIIDGGSVVAEYSDGRELPVGQLAIGSLLNPDSLAAVGNNYLATTSASAEMRIGAPKSEGRGSVLAGNLESSTVDLAGQLTELITYQRGYQAGSKIITTADQLMEEALSLKR